MQGNRILLVVGGGIAAFKVPELIRLLRQDGIAVTPVLTKAGAEFVTPLTLSALAESPCHQELFDLTRESEMGHIQLSRAADLLVVVPATANLMAKMVAGIADDLATTLLLATDKPVMIAPAMNVRMWEHPATRRNHDQLLDDGVQFVGPDDGAMACGEFGAGRMAEPEVIFEAIRNQLNHSKPLRLPPEAVVRLPQRGPLSGRHVIVTSGPTHEPIDPVRYIANRSSGAQGT
uniref:bifunctional phosphopantothenoylcysteine decarboxylase/phosphopantothenate--cysteine ligase CoaBC n=1 Tax=Paracoccus sp. TaxID=267 RepID=UPI00289FA4A7